MDTSKSKLYQEFSKLSLNSIKSVQSGQTLSALDSYLHVERPVENMLKAKMDEINAVGGGIVLLVGSAGDGKSHLLSKVRGGYDWGDDSFYNDATASCSPTKTAVQTLKEALSDFRDDSIAATTRKMVLAINLGKLNAFIEDAEVCELYSQIVKATAGVFDDDDSTNEEETDRIKIVFFAKEQIFELVADSTDQYPVTSIFLSAILEKIVSKDSDNPFRVAYETDKNNDELNGCPLVVNYEMLSAKCVRDTIVKTIIEAIVRFGLIITPREFLDFVSSIVIYKGLDGYNEKTEYFDALLPSLLYSGGENLVLRAISKLDPVVYSCSDHDTKLSSLFTSYAIPKDMETQMLSAGIPCSVIKKVNAFYKNNGRELKETIKFILRLYHLLEYHSESPVYQEFIVTLPRVLCGDNSAMSRVYEIVAAVLPRHYGSFYSRPNMIPLEIQGGKYKLFTNLDFEPKLVESDFDKRHPTRFPLYMNLAWEVGGGEETLKLDYQMFMYLSDLEKGLLVTSFNNEKSISFGSFVRRLAARSNRGEVTVVNIDGTEKKLKKTFGNVRLA